MILSRSRAREWGAQRTSDKLFRAQRRAAVVVFAHRRDVTQILMALYWDAQHIDEGVRFLKQRAQPLA